MSDYLKQVLLVGCGYMGREYTAVLQALDTGFTVVGRGKASAGDFFQKTGVCPVLGGLEQYLKENVPPVSAIVAVNAESLFDATVALLENGVRSILLEKPGAVTYAQIDTLAQIAEKYHSLVYIAYNRRFYASVQRARELIAEDGGVSSFNFEFTEWTHRIAPLNRSEIVLNNWFLCNSTHVVDLAFYLGGIPETMSCFVSGSLNWYQNARFSGSGITQRGACFSYHADWASAGRWSVEVLTKKRKLILCPLEELRSQIRGSITVEKLDLDDSLDTRFKPGLYLQTKAFLEGRETSGLLSLTEHAKLCRLYQQIEHRL